ncbi:hypothetical protein BGX38DRAFT_1281579 [Terfezia claveryi]|nr:hypothetical protein BGX38DRAFT_1281579 [Terfezia claveryi]
MYFYYLCVITVLLVILSRHVVWTTVTTTTTITPTTITTTTTTTRTTITTRTTTTTTTSITPERGASASQTIDLDAVVQRSIDCQVLAEMKAEWVLQYCINQVKYQPAPYQLDSQLPPFLRRDKVRWNNQWIDSHLELITETDLKGSRGKASSRKTGRAREGEGVAGGLVMGVEGWRGRASWRRAGGARAEEGRRGEEMEPGLVAGVEGWAREGSGERAGSRSGGMEPGRKRGFGRAGSGSGGVAGEGWRARGWEGIEAKAAAAAKFMFGKRCTAFCASPTACNAILAVFINVRAIWPLKRWKSFDLPFGVVAMEEVESEVNMVAIEGVIGRLILELLEKVEIVARKRLM